jgi:pyridoxamine 5'-phosphate oxidase family protein
MSVFADTELEYLRGPRRLGRLATVGRDNTPHVVPVGWVYNADHDTIDVGGYSMERTKKYRDVQRVGRAAIVIDELVSVSPWTVRGIEIRGRAEALDHPTPLIRIHPERIISWGIESKVKGGLHARNVGTHSRKHVAHVGGDK